MDIRRRTSLATALLALVLTAGCSDGADPADTDAAVDEPAATASGNGQAEASESAAATAEDGPVTFSTLTGEATRLSLDDGVLSALSGVGVELSATGGAQSESAAGATTFVFPVTGGQATVDPDGTEPFTGTVEHAGGLQLSALGRSATVDGLVLDGEQDALTAMVGGRRVPLLPLATDPQITADGEQATLAYSAGRLDTSAVDGLADQLGLPGLPPLDVNSLEATLEGS